MRKLNDWLEWISESPFGSLVGVAIAVITFAGIAIMFKSLDKILVWVNGIH